MRLFSIALAVAVLNCVSVAGQSRDSLVGRYTRGVSLSAQERYADAVEAFEGALAIDSLHDPSMYGAAEALMEVGEKERALRYVTRAEALDPTNSWYRSLRGRILVEAGRLDDAVPVFERIVAAGGRNFDPDDYRLLAMLYYRQGRTDDALATLDKAEVRIGATSNLIEIKRALLIEANRIDEAAAVTERFVAANPYDESNRLALASIYAYQRKDSLQLATLRQVVGINPDNAEALGALAEVYLARGNEAMFVATVKQIFTLREVPLSDKMARLDRMASSVNFYRNNFFAIGELALSLVAQYPDEAAAVEFYADHAVREGDAEGGLRVLKSRLSRPSPAISTFEKTIQIEAYLKRPDSVAVYSDRALRLFPGEVQIYLLRAGALQYLGRTKESLRTLDKALKVARTDSLRSEIHGAIGTTWHEAGNDRKTFASYERALAFNRDNALVLNNYAYYLAVGGQQLDRALGMAQRAVKIQKNSASYLDTYAWVLYRVGDYAEAKRVMQQALPLDRDGSAELLIHYGDILWALGEKFMASVYWKKARDAGWQPVGEIEERLARE